MIHRPKSLRGLIDRTRVILAKPGDYVRCEPNSEQQRRFIESDEFELFFGGGTGGGKTVGTLLAALRFVHCPGYGALIIRRTFASLSLRDSPMWLANDWLEGTRAKPQARIKGLPTRWLFPTPGAFAVLQFAHCQHIQDVQRLMGPSWHFVAFEELGEFGSRDVYTTIKTRLRKPAGTSIPLRLRANGNPGGPGQSWIAEDLVFRDNGARYIHSTYLDNPAIDQESYGEVLESLRPTEKAYYKFGDWKAKRTGRIYPVEDVNIFEGLEILGDDWRFILGVDLGSSQAEPTCAFSVLAHNLGIKGTNYLLESYKLSLSSPTEVASEIRKAIDRYPCRVVVDPGALGDGYIAEFQARHQIPCLPVKKRPGYKAAARAFFAASLQAQKIFIHRTKCADFLAEADLLVWDDHGIDSERGAPDHCTDSALYAFISSPAYTHHDVEPPPTKEEIGKRTQQEMRARAERDARMRLEEEEAMQELFYG